MNKYFGTWKFYSRALMIALPVMAQLLIQNFVSLIDNFMVAGLGDIKMSGVNVAGIINFVFLIFANTICMSGGIFMSQFNGARDTNGMKQTFRFKLLVTGVSGLLYATLCFAAPHSLFSLMVTSNSDADAIISQSQIYSRAVALSWFLMCISQSIASSLREIEEVRAPLVISVIATLVNTFFNFVFIYGNFGSPRLEVAGAGIATVIARFTELTLFILYVLKKRPDFLFNITKLFDVDWKLFARILKKSIMLLYSEIVWALSEAVSNALYNTRGGAEVVAGIAAGFAVSNLFFICFSGIVTATTVILGQELGKGKIEDCRKYKNWVLTGSTVFGIIFMILGFATTLIIPFVYYKLSVTAKWTAKMIVIVSAAYLPLWAFLNAQYAISRSGGDTLLGVFADTVGNTLFLGGMFALTFLTSLGPVAMYAIVKISDVPKAIVAHFWLKKERWLKNLAS